MPESSLIIGRDRDIASQTSQLEAILNTSPLITSVLDVLVNLQLPNYYLGGGAIAQTVWNTLSDFDPAYGIKDLDVVYFEDEDISEKRQESWQAKLNEALKGFRVPVEVVNEARVHLWYKDVFGRDIPPYMSTEDAINTWPVRASCIGVKRDITEDGKLLVYAPYGLNNIFGMEVKPNKGIISKEDYERKAQQWKTKWPRLKVSNWEETSIEE